MRSGSSIRTDRPDRNVIEIKACVLKLGARADMVLPGGSSELL